MGWDADGELDGRAGLGGGGSPEDFETKTMTIRREIIAYIF